MSNLRELNGNIRELNGDGQLEIPSGSTCASEDDAQLICPFMCVKSKTEIYCNVFLEHVEAGRYWECVRGFPNGAVIAITLKEPKT